MATTTTHPPCGKSWTGAKPEHCPVCCETFGGTRTADRHRVGPMGDRNCLHPAQIGAVQDARGIWVRPYPRHRRRRARAQRVAE